MEIKSDQEKKGHWFNLTIAEALSELKTDGVSGLSEKEAAERLEQHGPNELLEQGRKKPIFLLIEQFTSTLVIILIIAAIISGFLGKPIETIAILTIVFLFAFLSFIQEYRAEKAMAALKKLTVPRVKIVRNNLINEIFAQDLVPGDIIILETGNLVPADIRLIESVNLRIQESMMTGESEPVDKEIDAINTPTMSLGDRKNLGYMGTIITYGHGKGVVFATGMQTELGKIATLIQETKSDMTPLQRRLNQVGKIMAILGISVAILVMLIGIIHGETWSEMFLTAVSVAVAVVPEGLPAVVTVTLALGAQRMLRRNALIRKLPAVETLGSVTVICSDKTGTLTENRMTVMIIDVAGKSVELSDVEKKSDASFHDLQQQPCGQQLFENKPKSVCMVLLGGALCNDAWLRPDPETGKILFFGDPTEGALLVAASHAEIFKTKLYEILPRVSELPFDSVRKRMTTVHKLPDNPAEFPPPLQMMHIENSQYLSVTKGAVDHLLNVSSHVWVGDQSLTMDDHWRKRIELSNNEMANKGMRVLGVAIRWLNAIPPHRELASLEQNLTFIGLIGMIDPPRPEVKQAIQTCQQAKIRPVMITGDHPLTARFIANELGISTNGNVLTGQDLDELSEADFETAVQKNSVFARVAPEHKLKIVQALQNQGNIVAMTGDGVNDSPALKKADIGVAMGITGTDVSKEAANMILQDDNFATIVAAVEEGRVIYDNIRRFVKFSIAGNLGKVLVMLLSPLFGITVALLPLQLLWLNLLTDGLLGLGLGLEPAEKNTMRRPPRDPKANFFSDGLGIHVIWVGALIGAIALGVARIFFDPRNPSDSTWQTMLFTVLAFLQVGQALGSRSMTKATISLDFRSNPTMWLMIIAVFLLQIAVIYAPFMHRFFTVAPLRLSNFILCIVLMILVYIPVKLEKILRKEKAI